MTKIIVSILGNSGVGKTTLAQALCERFGYVSLLETHQERPFQTVFMDDLSKWGFHNQVDYLLYRAEQEQEIEDEDRVVILDGGLDNDFIFTGFFHEKGYLDQQEYAVCQRLYQISRSLLGFPALFIYLQAPVEVIVQRRIERNRDIDIIKNEDIKIIQTYLESWIKEHAGMIQLLTIPSDEEMLTLDKLDEIAAQIMNLGD